ncbi:MAG: hypothetical protein IT518_26865 [Burkholderiales bacterium]|nr:hypothetical protein [Burkholderiales bacterium]
MRTHAILVALIAAAGGASAASAAPCYVIYDRNDAVIFRDYAPPFDLSDPNAPERKMMRQQGQHLLVAEFDNCNPVGFISPTTGSNAATVDEIVAGVQPAIATSVAKSGGVASAGAQPGARPAARGNVK